MCRTEKELNRGASRKTRLAPKKLRQVNLCKNNFQKVFCSESVEKLEIHEISAKNEMPVDHQKNDLKQEVLIKKTDDIYSINGVYSD